MLKFDLRGLEVKLHGVRQDSPPKMISVDTDEDDRRLDLVFDPGRFHQSDWHKFSAPRQCFVQ
jgi:hypothetical protein